MNLKSIQFVYAIAALTVALSCTSNNRAFAQSPPFWSEIQAFVERDRITGTKPCGVVFVGSSSIRFWVTLKKDVPKQHIVRRGFGGGHLTHVNRYFAQLIRPHRPSKVVLYAGENDIAAGRSPKDVLNALKNFLNLKSKALNTTPVYFIAIKPSRYHWDKFAKQARTNALIHEYATTRPDLVFIDVVPLMLRNGKPKNIYVADGLHMNRAGYKLWKQAVTNAFERSDVSKAQHCKS